MVAGLAEIAAGGIVIATVTALGLFGWMKGHFTGTPPLRSALQTMLIGGGAAAAAFGIARAIS